MQRFWKERSLTHGRFSPKISILKLHKKKHILQHEETRTKLVEQQAAAQEAYLCRPTRRLKKRVLKDALEKLSDGNSPVLWMSWICRETDVTGESEGLGWPECSPLIVL